MIRLDFLVNPLFGCNPLGPRFEVEFMEIHEGMIVLVAKLKAIYIVRSYVDMMSFELVQPPQGPVRRSISLLRWLNMQSHPQANHT